MLSGGRGYAKSPGPNSEYRMDSTEFRSVVRTNELNMREDPIRPRRPDEYRVVFLGDSFTFGVGVDVEKSWVDLLEPRVDGQGKRLYAINAGGRGRYAGPQFDFFLEHAAALDPDLLFVQIYIGNDFADAVPDVTARSASAAAAEEEGPVKAALRPAREWLRAHPLKTLELAWLALLRFEAVHGLLFQLDLRYDERTILLREHPVLEQRLVDHELASLGRIHDWASQHGKPMLVMLVPMKLQVLRRNYLDPARYDYDKPNRILREFCAQRGIPVIDFLPIYDAMTREAVEPLYFRMDMHWTEAGHRHALAETERFLAELPLGFVPAAQVVASPGTADPVRITDGAAPKPP
jgi:hypothetical protein